MNDLSIIIPIGEGDQSWKTLASDLISLPLGAEIIFVGTRFEPAAMEVLSRSLAPGRKVRWVTAEKGRASQMNAGARQASKSYFWFLHADSLLENTTLIELENSLKGNPEALHYFHLKFSESLNGLMKLNEWGVKFRSQVLKMPFGDQGFVVSKRIFDQLGGFPLNVPYGEDHLLIWKARQAGIELTAVQGSIKTSARKYQKRGWLKTTLLHQWLTYKQALPEWVKLMRMGKCIVLLSLLTGLAQAQESPQILSASVVPGATAVWIDTDIAIGVPLKDVDDGYAIAHALTLYRDRIKGISTVFGNSTKLKRSVRLVNALLSLSGSTSIPVYLGARNALDWNTDASRALAEQLKSLPQGDKLTILALGRMTNIRAALELYPEGASRIDEVVFIGGRTREGEPRFGRFQVTLTDSNFWGDESSFRFVLDHQVHVSLMSTELAQHFSLLPRDLRWLKRQSNMGRWLVKRSKIWLRIWQLALGERGFYPFDLMASAYLTDRAKIHCIDEIPMKILLLPDTHFFNRGRRLRNRPVVSGDYRDAPYTVRYCDSATSDFKQTLLTELAGQRDN